jgi:tetratricopeptide (TPR) repeat protein
MSAGEFFDLVRPAFLFVSAFLSTWVLISSTRAGFRLHSSLAWALASLFLPLVVVPLYLFVRITRPTRASDEKPKSLYARYLLPALYLLSILLVLGAAQYQERRNVDTYLARATQARIAGDRANAINEYRKALQLEDNAHTHKLLGVQLSDAGDLNGALSEFRLAEKGSEPDRTLSFRIAALLDLLNKHTEAIEQYKRFLQSEACTNEPVEEWCAVARRRLVEIESVRLGSKPGD